MTSTGGATTPSGGATSTGGMVPLDGAVATGGITGQDATIDAAGGTGGGELDGGLSTGGVTGAGGATSAGGAQALGGTSGAGGATSQGGALDAGSTASAGGMTGTGGSTSTGGTTGTGGTASTGGMSGTGGSTSAGGTASTGGITGTGGTTNTGGATGPVICKPASAVISDFSSSSCIYGAWGDGEMNTSAWAYGNGTSTISATCGAGKWTFQGTLGPATSNGANQAGFGFTPGGYVHDSATNSNVDCTVFDLSAYSGLTVTAVSASGAITKLGIGITLADGTKGTAEIPVSTTATTVTVTWAQLGITSAARMVGLWGYFLSGASNVTDDLVISAFGLK